MADDVVELSLSRSVNVTNTSYVRASLASRIESEGLDGPPIELVWFHVFILCTSGSGMHMVDFDDHNLSPGTALWIRPGQVQQWSPGTDFEADVVVFESSSVPDLPLFEQLLGATVIAQLGDDAERLRQQVAWMSADLEATGDEATAAAAVSVIMRVFARHASIGGSDDDSPRRRLASAFIDSIDEFVHERSVSWHARRIGASPRSVARATAECLSQRPKDVIDARVILEVQRRLAWSSDDVATIARALQFSDSSNFTKYFRARTGMSPSAFRIAVGELGSAVGELGSAVGELGSARGELGPAVSERGSAAGKPPGSQSSGGRRSRGTPAPAPR